MGSISGQMMFHAVRWNQKEKRNMMGATNASCNCKFSTTLQSKVATVKKKKKGTGETNFDAIFSPKYLQYHFDT